MPTLEDRARAHRYRDFDNGNTGAFVIVITILALLSIGYLVFSANTPPAHAFPLESAHARVEIVTGGHGSATHIGGGYFVTAAHVADKGELTVNGYDADLLWFNSTYDIALLRVGDGSLFESVPLSCATADVGTTGQSYGNPMDFHDIATTLTVAGEVGTYGHWKVALPMDGNIGPGMSGGGWIVDGKLAGVNVGAALAPVGFGASFYGLSVIVPASVVCDLMGRS